MSENTIPKKTMRNPLTPEQRREILEACIHPASDYEGADYFPADPARIAAYVEAKVQEALVKRMLGKIDYNSPEFHDGYITGFAEGSSEYKEQYGESKEKLVDFIEAKVREEREACAKLAEVSTYSGRVTIANGWSEAAELPIAGRDELAAAIRARGTGK